MIDTEDDLYTGAEVEELLTVAVLKATRRDRERLAALEAALRVADLGGLPASIVTKAMRAEQREEPEPEAEGDEVPHADTDEAELLSIAIEHVQQCQKDGADPQPGLDALHALLDDPDELETIAGVIEKGFDESKHPRAKNGRFIGRDRIQAAQHDPKKAEELRKEVKPEDAKKLEDALAGKSDVGRTQRGQKKHETKTKREAVAASRNEAKRISTDLMLHPGSRTPENYAALVPHLSALSGRELSDLRTKLGASFGGTRDVEGRRAALLAYAQQAGQPEEPTNEQGAPATNLEAPPVRGDEAGPRDATGDPAQVPEVPEVPEGPTAANELAPATQQSPESRSPAVDVAGTYQRTAEAKHSEVNAAMRAAAGMNQKQAADELRKMRMPPGKNPKRELIELILERKRGQIRYETRGGSAGKEGDERKREEYRTKFDDEPLLTIDQALAAPEKPATKPRAPKTAAKAPDVASLKRKPGADKEHLETLAAAEADPDAREYLTSAAHNARPATNDMAPEDRRHNTIERLAAAHRDAHDDGKPGAAAKVADVIQKFGGTLAHEAGAEVPFDPARYEAPAGTSPDDSVRVVRPAVLGPDGREAVKGAVEAIGAAPAKTQAQIAAEITAKRQAKGPRSGADDARPTAAEVEEASRPAKPKGTPKTPKPAKASERPAAPAATKYGQAGEGHPLGQSHDEQVNALTGAVGAAGGFGGKFPQGGSDGDPLGHEARGVPNDLDVGAFENDLNGIVGRAREAGMSGVTYDQVYPAIGKKYGLSKDEFARAMHHLDHSGRFRFGDWPASLDRIPDPALATMYSSTVNYTIPTGRQKGADPSAGDPSLNIDHPQVNEKYGRAPAGAEAAGKPAAPNTPIVPGGDGGNNPPAPPTGGGGSGGEGMGSHPSDVIAAIPPGSFKGTGHGNDAELPSKLASWAETLRANSPEDSVKSLHRNILSNNRYSEQARDQINSALRQSGFKTPPTPTEERAAIATAKALGYATSTQADGSLVIRVADPKSGNTVIVPITDHSDAGVKAATEKAAAEMKRRKKETATRVRAEKQVDNE